MVAHCGTCGYRINPDTARGAGLTSEKSLDDYCCVYNEFVTRQRNCPDWISYEEEDYEIQYAEEAYRRR